MMARLSSLITTYFSLLTRSFFIIVGCLAVLWGATEIHTFWLDSTVEQIADYIIEGDPFKVEILTRQLTAVARISSAAYCHPGALRSATIIRVRMMEMAVNANEHKSDENLKSLDGAIRSSLSCSPADPFLWLVLYSLKERENGYRPEDVEYLRMSYRLGPREGWIAVKRNRLAFSEIQRLPADLSDAAINEFVGLVGSGFSEQAAEIFIGPAWRMRRTILSRLKDVPHRYREQFSNALQRRGYDIDGTKMVRPGEMPALLGR